MKSKQGKGMRINVKEVTEAGGVVCRKGAHNKLNMWSIVKNPKRKQEKKEKTFRPSLLFISPLLPCFSFISIGYHKESLQFIFPVFLLLLLALLFSSLLFFAFFLFCVSDCCYYCFHYFHYHHHY